MIRNLIGTVLVMMLLVTIGTTIGCEKTSPAQQSKSPVPASEASVPTQKPSSSRTAIPESGAPKGFTNIGNFAIALGGMKAVDGSVYGDKIELELIIMKTSPAVENAQSRPQNSQDRLGTIELIDDHGEKYAGSIIGWLGPPMDMRAIPPGFVFVIDVRTTAPALALGHIRTISVDGRPLSLTDYRLTTLQRNDQYIPFGQRVSIDEWLSIEAQEETWEDSAKRLALTVRAFNGSYDTKGLNLAAAYQTNDGRIHGRFYSSLPNVKGQASGIAKLTLTEWSSGYSGPKPSVQAYLVHAYYGGTGKFLVVRPH